MNEYCKNHLKHSWGRTPERKQLEKEYNMSYYKANRNRILKRASERRGNLNNDYNDIVTAPLTLYENGEFAEYSVKAFRDIMNIAPATINKIKKTKEIIEHGKKFVLDKLELPIKAIKNTKLVKSVKNFFDRVKYYLSKSTVKLL